MNPGTRLGPYEITASIGAGGMGEVYRGRDTRLDRNVAIKLLPAEFAANAQLKLRFEREAKTISQLNHPHICALYDVGHDNGLDYLVMEYIEGESLADRLTRGPLPIDAVLDYAVQIADALDKAHRQGIIHRDLKPGNIMLTQAGAKLLDFGLAKLSLASAPVQGFTDLATEHKPLTQEGTILGTFQYMAPEQLEGQEADARTDIFAFGAVLYEMVTGRRAFEGKSKTSLIAAIVDRDPPSITVLQPMTPPALEHTIRKCLEKDLNDRWQSAHDLKSELQWIAEAGSQAGVAAPVILRRKHRERLAWGLHPLTALAVAALTWGVLELRHEPPRVLQSSLLPPQKAQYTFDVGAPAISPDGTRVAFLAQSEGGQRMLWVRPLDGLSAQPLAGTDEATYPFWSPDGRQLAFFAGGRLRKINASGGPPQTLCEASGGRGGAWSRDGTILFTPTPNEGIFRVSAAGGIPTQITRVDAAKNETSHRWPSFLPDQKHFLYFSLRTGGIEENNAVFIASVDGKVNRQLFAAGSNAMYAPPGYLLFWRERSLVAQPFDAKRLEFTGEVFPVAEAVERTGNRFDAMFSVSRNGTLAYQAGSSLGSSRLVWLDREGKELGVVGPPADYTSPAISHDGTRVAANVVDPGTGRGDIWVHDLARGTATRLTFGPADEYAPIWSPDDKTILFSSNETGSGDLYSRLSSGIGAEEKIYASPQWTIATDWSLDGKTITFQEMRPKSEFDIWLYSVAERKATPFLQTSFNEVTPRLSPDGRWLLYRSNESGKPQIYVQDISGRGGKWQISTEGGTGARWRRDGKEIFYVSPDWKLMSVPVETAPEFRAGIPKPLFPIAMKRSPGMHYDITADGKRFLVNSPIQQAVVAPVTLVQNWTRAISK